MMVLAFLTYFIILILKSFWFFTTLLFKSPHIIAINSPCWWMLILYDLIFNFVICNLLFLHYKPVLFIILVFRFVFISIFLLAFCDSLGDEIIGNEIFLFRLLRFKKLVMEVFLVATFDFFFFKWGIDYLILFFLLLWLQLWREISLIVINMTLIHLHLHLSRQYILLLFFLIILHERLIGLMVYLFLLSNFAIFSLIIHLLFNLLFVNPISLIGEPFIVLEYFFIINEVKERFSFLFSLFNGLFLRF